MRSWPVAEAMMSGGAMQDWPLLLWRIIDHAALYHGRRQIVTNTVEGGIHRTDWASIQVRAKQVAQALVADGIGPGDRIATLAWNTWRHVELWYGVTGMAGVCHTLNPRLFADQLVYIINHAADRVLCFDLSFLAIVEAIAPRLQTVERWVCLTDAAHLPASVLPLVGYEDWIAPHDGAFEWVELDERAPAGLCYTSGTTGDPKGVEYTHRSNVLMTLAVMGSDSLSGHREVIMPIVPMFHANAWGIPFSAAALGQGLVLNGPTFDAPTLHRLILEHGVTATAGVPTVWLGLLQHLDATGGDLGPLKRLLIGGAAAPPSMIAAFEDRYGVEVMHSWGMTEMSPLGVLGTPTVETEMLPLEQRRAQQVKQGRPPFGVEMRVRGSAGVEAPRDGEAYGRLMVRGPWVVKRYYKAEEDAVDEQGWFDTGDVATLDPLGYMHIVDRAKDVIKSGGEWISSIEVETIAMGCPGVAEAAVIGVPHPKWDERPVLIVVRKPGSDLSADEVLAYLSGKIAKWWTPDAVIFVEDMPHTASGKVQKVELRARFAGHILFDGH